MQGGRVNLSPQLAARGLRPAAELADSKPCGTRIRYVGGCRCFRCRRANSDYERERQKARAGGDWNGIVDAAEARRHILKLSRKGIGRRSITAATDIADSILVEIKNGARKRIRARTARKILSVTTAAIADRAFVPAGKAWSLIGELIDEGFTKTAIAHELGYGRALQLNKVRITARNDLEVKKLHRRLMS
jgi:hypothetical protein